MSIQKKDDTDKVPENQKKEGHVREEVNSRPLHHPSDASVLDSVLRKLPKANAYRAALESVIGEAASLSAADSKPELVLNYDELFALLDEMDREGAWDKEPIHGWTLARLIDAVIRRQTVQLDGVKHQKISDALFFVGMSRLLQKLGTINAVRAFGVDTVARWTTNPPPRVKYHQAALMGWRYCPTEECANDCSTLPLLPSNPREELTQASVGLGFLSLSMIALMGEVIDPLVFHRSASDASLVLTLLFGSYALDRFTSLFQGRLSNNIDKGIRRLVGGDEKREAFCDAASFVVAYRLGLASFPLRPQAVQCLTTTDVMKNRAHRGDDPFEKDALIEEEWCTARYVVWLLARTAAERCIDEHLIESDMRQARMFLTECLASQRHRKEVLSTRQLPSPQTDGTLCTSWDTFTLRWAFGEATAMVRSEMSTIKRIASMMMDGRTPGECVVEIEDRYVSSSNGRLDHASDKRITSKATGGGATKNRARRQAFMASSDDRHVETKRKRSETVASKSQASEAANHDDDDDRGGYAGDAVDLLPVKRCDLSQRGGGAKGQKMSQSTDPPHMVSNDTKHAVTKKRPAAQQRKAHEAHSSPDVSDDSCARSSFDHEEET